MPARNHDRDTFRESTFGRLNRVLRNGARLRVTHLLVSGDTVVVEMEALSTALNGTPFNNTYCWVCRFQGGLITEVRAKPRLGTCGTTPAGK